MVVCRGKPAVLQTPRQFLINTLIASIFGIVAFRVLMQRRGYGQLDMPLSVAFFVAIQVQFVSGLSPTSPSLSCALTAFSSCVVGAVLNPREHWQAGQSG